MEGVASGEFSKTGRHLSITMIDGTSDGNELYLLRTTAGATPAEPGSGHRGETVADGDEVTQDRWLADGRVGLSHLDHAPVSSLQVVLWTLDTL